MRSDIEILMEALEDLIDRVGGEGAVEPPRGYPHIGLAIIDAVFSLRARYASVEKIVHAYCARPDLPDGPVTVFDDSDGEFDVGRLLADLSALEDEELAARFNNWQRAPGTSRRKALVVRELAEALNRVSVISRRDLQRLWETGELLSVERAACNVPGVGCACWRYLLSLSGIEKIKPDTMVQRWVSGALSRKVRLVEGGNLLEQAATGIQVRGSPLSIRAVDHLVWRVQSGSLKMESEPPKA